MELNIKIGIIVLIFGFTILIVGLSNVNNLTWFLETISDNTIIQMMVLALIFTPMFMFPIMLRAYYERTKTLQSKKE